MASIGDRLREARGGLSMAKAALLVDISQQAWNLYEKDKSAPGAKLIQKICSAFGISSDWLLGIETESSSVHVTGDGNAVAIGSGAKASSRTVREVKRESESCAKCPHKILADAVRRAASK